MVAYTLELTKSEIAACEFARGRYSWPDALLGSLNEENSTVEFAEHEMWQWSEDVEADMVGGHSPFPLASPRFASKLQTFLDRMV